MSHVVVLNSDPQVMSDIFNKHNKKIDKVDEIAKMFEPLLGSSLLFGPTDEDWRQKRKACAHAFYKDRLKHMLEVLKGQINQRIIIWKSKIEQSDSGETQTNIAEEFASIFADNIINIAFGEDLRESKFELNFLVDKQAKKFKKRSVNI